MPKRGHVYQVPEGLVLVWRNPPRCLDCPHPVGPSGSHYTNGGIRPTGWVRCRECPPDNHEVSMSLPYPGTWRKPK